MSLPNCNKAPYNINNITEFNNFNKNPIKNTNYDAWLYCLNKNMFTDIDKNIMNTHKLIYNNNSTSEEINNYSMTLYKNDLNYTFGKILFLIVVIITYMYCFKVTGIIQPLMVFFEKFKMGVNTVSDKINKEIPKIKEKIPEIKENIKGVTNKLTNKLSKNASK